MDFSPTYADVRVTRAMLQALRIPTEVVLEILDYAQYEPVLEFANTRGTVTVGVQLCLEAGVLTRDSLRKLQPGKACVQVKEIDFLLDSHDQGWTSEDTVGTFNTSSWVEVSILRGTHPALPFTSTLR